MQQCVRQAVSSAYKQRPPALAGSVVRLVKMSQSHEVGVLNTAPLSFQQLTQALVGPHKQ